VYVILFRRCDVTNKKTNSDEALVQIYLIEIIYFCNVSELNFYLSI